MINTVKQALYYMADLWSEAVPATSRPAYPYSDPRFEGQYFVRVGGFQCFGLCRTVSILVSHNIMDKVVFDPLMKIIKENTNPTDFILIGNMRYHWPLNKEGAKQRSNFCRDQADKTYPITSLKHAWQHVANYWSQATTPYFPPQSLGIPPITAVTVCGSRYGDLSSTIRALVGLYEIDTSLLSLMLNVIPAPSLPDPWPFNEEGKKIRIKFCQDQAERCFITTKNCSDDSTSQEHSPTESIVSPYLVDPPVSDTREIKYHHDVDGHSSIQIFAKGERDTDNTQHLYRIVSPGSPVEYLSVHSGPLTNNHPNGLTDAILLSILLDRFTQRQLGLKQSHNYAAIRRDLAYCLKVLQTSKEE